MLWEQWKRCCSDFGETRFGRLFAPERCIDVWQDLTKYVWNHMESLLKWQIFFCKLTWFSKMRHTHTHLHSIINMSHLGQVCHVWSREFETRGCRLRDNYYLWMNIQGWTHCKRTQISKDLGVFGESSGAGNLSSKRLFGKREKSWNIFWSKGLACLEI